VSGLEAKSVISNFGIMKIKEKYFWRIKMNIYSFYNE